MKQPIGYMWSRAGINAIPRVVNRADIAVRIEEYEHGVRNLTETIALVKKEYDCTYVAAHDLVQSVRNMRKHRRNKR